MGAFRQAPTIYVRTINKKNVTNIRLKNAIDIAMKDSINAIGVST